MARTSRTIRPWTARTSTTQPPSHSFWKTNKTQVNNAAGVLGSYNEGAIGRGHCSEALVRLLILAQ